MVKQLWRDVWRVLNMPISLEGTVKGSVDSLKTIAELAKALRENKSAQELEPLVNHFSSLLDVLSSPLGQVATATLPFVPLATGLLKYIVEATRQEPTLEVGVAIAAQAAYLKSVQVFLEQHPELVQRLSDQPASEALTNQIQQVGKKLELDGKEVELTEQEARKTLICFHESKLARIFNELLSQRLQEAGLSPEEGDRTTERIARSTHRYLKEIVAEVRDQVKRLAAVYGEGWFQDQERYASVDRYLEEVIARKPQETVFDEPFTFADLYVPLQVQPVDREGQVDYRATPLNIETWAETLLQDAQKQGQVLFIQGGPGRGKSVFCRMFADKVRREWSPTWIPLLIRLRDVQHFAHDFDKTLEDAIATDFTKDAGWLTDRNTRFLFFLDGFDELLLERGTSGGLQQFLDQVGLFQKRCAENSERDHRVVITGRPLALYGVERLMPLNLERVEIAPMAQEIQQQWFVNWEKLAGSEKTQQFQAFLQNQQCPEQVKTLATEPSLLYLMAALHRDGKLQESQLTGDDPVAVRIQIYEAALAWMLTWQHSENGVDLNPRMTGLDPEDLRSILAEAGLCVVQSGGESAAIALIEERLKEDEGAKQLLARAKQNAEQNLLKNALAAFYLKSAEGSENQIEFFHRSFGEFLCAERMVESLVRWTKKEEGRAKRYRVSEQTLLWEIYDLLGFGVLTPEIVEYLIGLLKKAEPDWVELFNRLESFYLDWCDGKFIDATEETLPQRKARQLRGYGIPAGQRRVDIFTSINVCNLLWQLHRYAQTQEHLKEQIYFYPCGKPDTNVFDQARLLRFINYCQLLGEFTFGQTVGMYLQGADLSNVYLDGANLSGANLSGADLSRANLQNANLSGANCASSNFSQTNLHSANLANADFHHADLARANLSNASLGYIESSQEIEITRTVNFSHANLSNAILQNAQLRNVSFQAANLGQADLQFANLNNVDLSSANLSHANLSHAILRDSSLVDACLQNTCFAEADLSNSNLRGARLQDTNLQGSNLARLDLSEFDFSNMDLTGANLGGTNLVRANLRETNLSRVQAAGADFTGSLLTAACLENWNIDGTTKLNKVICDYVYLESEKRERRPSDGNFNPGEFTILFQKALATVDLIFSNGLDLQALSSMLQELCKKYGKDKLSVQSLERKGNGKFVVRLDVPPEADKADIERNAKLLYQELLVLKAKVESQERLIATVEKYNEGLMFLLQAGQSRSINVEVTAVGTNQDTFHNHLSGANVANFANQVSDNARQQANQYNYTPEQRQTLAEAAKEIQQLLDQLSTTYPSTTVVEQTLIAAKAAEEIDKNPALKQRVIGALTMGGTEALKEFVKHPAINVFLAAIEGWKKPS